MTEIFYYVAASLDGYIATPDGGVDWLSELEHADEDYGYSEFLASVDALIMGSATYEQVLGFGEWPYGGKPCWVLSTRSLEPATPTTTITSQTPTELVAGLAERGVERAWLVGGAALAASFRSEGLISEYIVSVMPIILGGGIHLFSGPGPQEPLALVEAKPYESGVVQLTYTSSMRV
jgi:dihydrofolate reductase